MSNLTTFSRSGVTDGDSGTFAKDNSLFLKVFSGEILTTFEENNVMKGLHTVRTISSGKSAQFPTTGVATAKYHTAGQDIMTESNSYISEVKHGEKVINIDDVLISSTFLANIDELKNHYDVRSIYAKELGKALAKRFDIATMKVLISAANSTTAAYTGGPTTAAITPTAASGAGNSAVMTAAELIDALYAAAQSLDESDVPSEGRFALLQPQDYYTLITSDTTAITTSGMSPASNRDFGGTGNIATGTISSVAGINLIKTNHIKDVTVIDASQDQDDDNANNSTGTSGYNADYSATRFVVAHPSAIGTVKLLDLATESEYQIQRQGHLFVAKYAMGHGILRPECAVAVNPS